MDNEYVDLSGTRPSDYEQYLNLPALLACQQSPQTLTHDDELMFQVTHQTAELWMKVEIHELTKVHEYIQKEKCLEAANLLNRVSHIHQLLIQQIAILETMSPWDYQAIRSTLGSGSGLDSPGFQGLMAVLPTLWPAFTHLLQCRKIFIDQIYVEQKTYYPEFLLAEALISIDEQFQTWCFHHYKLVEREIGGNVESLKGQSTDFLNVNIQRRFFPDLWEVRNRLTRRAQDSS